jgi:hypothetical protein
MFIRLRKVLSRIGVDGAFDWMIEFINTLYTHKSRLQIIQHYGWSKHYLYSCLSIPCRGNVFTDLLHRNELDTTIY